MTVSDSTGVEATHLRIAELVQQLYSKNGRKRGQIALQPSPRGTKAKMQISAKSRRILHFRRRRIYRGVEQPGSSSVKPHIAKNQYVLILVQQLYSEIIRSGLWLAGGGTTPACR